MADWMQILRDAVRADPRGATGVAERMGVSRPAVSLLLAGRYPAGTERMAALVLERLGRRTCPHTGEEIGPEVCDGWAVRPMPTSNPYDLQQWRACRRCEHYPTQSGGE